jgi:hypothetical protein
MVTSLLRTKPLLRYVSDLPLFPVFGVVVLACFAYASSLPDCDANWRDVWYPVGRAVLEGHNPYHDNASRAYPFINPPWLLALLAPLSLLPYTAGRFLLVMLNWLAIGITARRLGASYRALEFLFVSFPVFHSLLHINIDGLALMGVLLPPQVGLFCVLLKPQFGVSIAIFWLYEAWRVGKGKAVMKTFAPIAAAFAVSMAFGPWFASAKRLSAAAWNMSLFPLSIPIGLLLLVQSLRTRDVRLALPASLFFSPYVGPSSWVAALVAIAHRERLILAVSLGLWLFIGIMYLCSRQ